ncbi:MAG: hypothetical protein K0R10_925 [Alphaproteobacteria bacterium]|nr:hypothetical protein [Alphaproteobacteria bacterium]
MASSDALSANTQKAVLEQLPAQHQDNKKSAQRRALWMGAGVVGFIAAHAFLPVAVVAIPSFVAAVVVGVNAFRLVSNASRALALHGVKKDASNSDFVPKLKQKAGKAMERAAKLNKISNIAFFTVIGAIVAPAIPVLAPLAAIVYPLAVTTMFAAWGASEFATGTATGTKPTAKLVYDRQVAEGVIRPAEDILPPAAQPAIPAHLALPAASPKSIFSIFSRRQPKEEAQRPAPKAAAPAAPKP